MRDRITALHVAAGSDPRDTLEAIALTLVDDRALGGFRGCEFVNAAAEYSDSAHPARSVTVSQRSWLMDVTAEALEQLGHPRPRRLARQMLMLRTVRRSRRTWMMPKTSARCFWTPGTPCSTPD